MKLIKRNYLSQLIEVIDTPDIKVITGVRRSGKSKLLDALYDYLNKPSKNAIRIRLTEKKSQSLLMPNDLYDEVIKQYKPHQKNYLLIDEIQLCHGFERVINSLHDEGKFDIYLTGSNAFLLSSDLATLFGGRTYEINVLPFSYREYKTYYNLDGDVFDQYLLSGGMSGSYLYHSRQDAYKYVKSIYKTTIVKDIITKYKIENENLLQMIAEYLMDTIGNKTSFRNIANVITNNYLKTNDKTVGAYVDYLCKSFLLYPISRFDIKGKGYLQTEKKYYLSDLSFRFSTLGSKHYDYGFLYENIVALELLRRGYEIYVGVLYKSEVDFVAIKDGKKMYIQVSDNIQDKKTFQREVMPLMKIKDSYPKMLIARTRHPESDYLGIKIIDIAEWLDK